MNVVEKAHALSPTRFRTYMAIGMRHLQRTGDIGASGTIPSAGMECYLLDMGYRLSFTSVSLLTSRASSTGFHLQAPAEPQGFTFHKG